MNVKTKIKKLIQQQDKEKAYQASLDALEKKEITVIELYEEVLRVVLYDIDCKENDKECIWREHVKSAIVRSIIEGSYKYVIEESSKVAKRNKRALIVCPSEEYHEIGAKMAHDYFLMNGFSTTFIGANTPLDVILNAVTFVNPDYIALSVTNYYNIINAKKIVKEIKKIKEDVIILAGGQAFNQVDALATCAVDGHIKSFDDIKELT